MGTRVSIGVVERGSGVSERGAKAAIGEGCQLKYESCN